MFRKKKQAEALTVTEQETGGEIPLEERLEKEILEESEKHKKQKKPEKQKKEKVRKERVRNSGLHTVRIVILWILFISAFIFAVYKNFTGIDTHTVHEKEIVKEKLYSTNGVEQFAKDFLSMYFTWDRENRQDRREKLAYYLESNLVSYGDTLISSAADTTSSLSYLTVWDVEKKKEGYYEVMCQVNQDITKLPNKERKEKETLIASNIYTLTVYEDKKGDLLIVRLPSLSAVPARSNVRLKQPQEMQGIDYNKKRSVEGFLEDFFKVYPASTEEELKYYAEKDSMPVIGKQNYKYEGIEKVLITSEKGNEVMVYVSVVYSDGVTDTKQTFQYNLTLKKGDTWKIIKSE